MTAPSDEIARLRARVRQLEEELAAELKATTELTEATEWGPAGVAWHVGFYSDGRPVAKRMHGWHEAVGLLADWDPRDPHPPVLLRSECTAPHRWPLTAEEADELSPPDLPD